MVELSLIVAVITGLSQLIKKYIPTQYIPFVALALGIIGGFSFVEGTVQYQVLVGLALGLSSMGLFDIAKVTKKQEDDG